MSGDDFQARYSNVMDGMLKSAIAETTKLFETMVDELKAEISKIKKENEDLKSKCNEFENAKNQPTANTKESEPDPGPSTAFDRRDTGVQCDLVPLRAMLVEQCHQFINSSTQSQEQQREHEEMEEGLQKEQQCDSYGEGNSQMTFILIKQEESDYDDSFPWYVLKQGDVEPTPLCRQVPSEIPGSPGSFVNGFTPEGPPINQPSSHGGLTFFQKDEETAVALETPCLAGDSGLGGAQSQASETEHPPVITLPAVKDDLGEQSEVNQQITETSTQAEVITLEEQPLVVAQQQSVVQLPEKEQPSSVTQQLQRESETLVNKLFNVALQPHADVPSTNEQLSEAAPLTKERASQELQVGLAEIEASSQPDSSIRRRRGRPPKRAKHYNSHQQPVEEKVLSPSINIPSVQEAGNTPSREVEKIEVSSLPVSAGSSSRGCSSEKEKPSQSQQLPMEMEEEAIQSPSIQVTSAVQTVNTPSAESPKAPSVQPRERHASYPTLQDAMLLVEAMNAQIGAYHSTMENTVSSQQTMAELPQTQYTSPLVTLQAATVAPGQLPTPISPETSAPPPTPQPPPAVPHQASFSLPTVEQSTTAQSSVQQFTVSSQSTVSPNQQSTSVAQSIIKAIVIPKQYAVIPSTTTASPMSPSTVATQTSVQSLQQHPLHPLITVVAPSKQLSNTTPQKIIVVPRPTTSFIPHTIAALSPTQLSTVVSTVVAAQKNSLPPASTAACLPLGTPSLPSVPLKTIVVTPRQSLSAVTSQTTATTTDQQSVTLPPPKITIVVPRQVPAVVPRQQQSTVAPQTLNQKSVEPPLTVAVSSAQSVSLSQQSSVTVDTPKAPLAATTLSQKWDNILDNLESPPKTATISNMKSVSTETCSNLKKSVSRGLVETSVPPKVPPVFQDKLCAVVKLAKLSLPASTKEMAPVLKTFETLSSFKDSLIHRPVPSTTQEEPSASTQPSPIISKEIIPFSKMPTLCTEIHPSLNAIPIAMPVQASALSKEPNAVQEKPSLAVKSTQSISATSAKEIAPNSTISTSSSETCSNLKDSSITRCVQPAVPPKVSATVLEKSSATINMTQPSAESKAKNAPVSETPIISTETSSNLKEVPISRHVQASVPPNEPAIIQEKPSTAPLRLTSIISKDTTSDPHLRMTKTQFLAQLAVSPVVHVQQKASSDALDPRTAHAETSTSDLKRLQKDSLVARLRSHFRTRLLARKTEPNPESFTEPEPTPVSDKKSRLAKDSVTHRKTTSEPIPVSTKKPVLAKAVATPEKTTINPTSISPRRSRLTKDVASPKKTVSKPTSVSPKRHRLSKDGASPKKTVSEPTSVSPKRHRLSKDGASLKKTVSEPTSVSPNRPRLSKDGASPKKTVSEPTSVSPKWPRLSKDGASPKKTVSEPTSVSLKRPRLSKDGASPKKTVSEHTSVSPKRPRLSKDVASPKKTVSKPTSVSPKRHRLSKDGASLKKTVSEPTSVSPNRPRLSKAGASPKKTVSEPTSVSLKRPRLSKDGASPKKTVSEPTSVSPKRPRLSKDGASLKKTNSQPTSVSPRRSRLTKDGAGPKKTTSEPSPLSPRCPRLAKDGAGPKKTRESTVAKKLRLIQDVTSPKKSIGVANAKKLTKAAKAKTLAKLKYSNQSKSQNGAETSQLAENHASREALKKAKAKAVWTPPRMSANKSPLTRGRSLSLLPAKRDTRSQNHAQAPTTLQRRSQSTSPRLVTPSNQIASTPPNRSQTVKPKSASKGCPSSPRIVVYPPSISLLPIPVRAPPIVSPLQPLSVIGRRLLKNQCGECGRVLSSMAALESHVSLHTGRRPFSCTLCGKSFPDSKGLGRHGRVHRNGRIHICSQCGKGFVYSFGLTKHLQMVHGRVKPFVCQICDKGFFTKRDVEAHIRVHTGEKPFHCNLCEKQFKRRVELNVHLRWHNGEKRHWCPYCGKGFLDFNNLKRHKYIHTGEKPHSCPHCPKNFTQSGHLKKHVKNVHKVE